jgi:hypothetical protein
MSTFLPYGVPVKSQGTPNRTTALGDSGSSFRSACRIFKNISIEDNLFDEFPRRSMILTSFDNVIVGGNRFVNRLSRHIGNPERGTAYAEMGRGLLWEGNSFNDGPYRPSSPIEADEESTEDIGVR